MVIKLNKKQYQAISFEYLPHLMLHLEELHLDCMIVEKGTILAYSSIRADQQTEDSFLLISSQSPEWVDDFVIRQVQAYEIMSEVIGKEVAEESANGSYDPAKHLSKIGGE